MNITAKANMPVGSMVINNPNNLRFSVNLVELLGVNPSLVPITIIKRLNSTITYFIHCDLVDKKQNLLNGKPSAVLARFDIRGNPFERCYVSVINLFRKTGSIYSFEPKEINMAA